MDSHTCKYSKRISSKSYNRVTYSVIETLAECGKHATFVKEVRS